MAFVGFITRKEQDTGVHLRAKIVTPSKKNYGYKEFPVRVKADALDDYSCCVIDHNTTKKNLEKNTLDDLRESITGMTQYRGANGTKIEYTIERKEGVVPNSNDDINKYLDAEGKIISRPKYSSDGTADVTGYIVVVVTKGEAKVSSKLPITVKGMTAEEVLANRDIYNQNDPKTFLWNLIKGSNSDYQNKGYLKIRSDLMFSRAEDISNDNLAKLSTEKLKCVWEIVSDGLGSRMASDTENFGKDGHTSLYDIGVDGAPSYSRIGFNGADKGKIYLPPYTSIINSGLYNEGHAFVQTSSTSGAIDDYRFIVGRSQENDAYDNNGMIDVDKIVIKATISLGDVSIEPIIYECATQSAPLTTQELAKFLDSVIYVSFVQAGNPASNQKILYGESNGAVTEKSIKVPTDPSSNATAKPVTITVPGQDYFISLPRAEYEKLALTQECMSGVVTFGNNGAPVAYECPDNQSANFETVSSTYQNCESMFCNDDGTQGSSTGFKQFSRNAFNNTSDPDDAVDYMRVASIPIGKNVGSAPGQDSVGLCLADWILSSNAPNRKKFVVKFSYKIRSIGNGAAITKTIAQPFIFVKST